MATPSSNSPAPSTTAQNVITLHVLSPAPEVSGGRITFSSISLETTISQLKARLQNSITAAPPPERQRLIYRGRALVDTSLTLRNIFQLELDTNNTLSTHTLHLVLPPTPSSNNTSTGPSAAGTVPAGTVPAASQPPRVPTPNQQIRDGPHFPHQAIAQAQAAQMMLQNQLTLLQQQLLMNNPAHASAEQMAQLQAQQHQRLAQQMGMYHQQHHPPPPPHHHHHHHHHQTPQEQTRAHGGIQDTRDSDHPTHMNPSQPSQNGQGHPSSAPLPIGPTTTTVHEGIGPNGSRMRVVVNETVNFHVSRQGTPVPLGPGMGQQPSTNLPLPTLPNPPNFPVFGPPSGQHPPLGFQLSHPNPLMASHRPSSASAHGQHNSFTGSQSGSAAATAWLLSTPSGPQALVFAPGHGYFSSALTPTIAQLTNLNRSAAQHSTIHHRQSSSDRVGHTPGPPNDPPILPAANGANGPPAQALARPAEPQRQRQANNNENDVFQFILQRGWLFLRLYIFMFVLSEPGTWRRWLLLAVAVVVCLLPRDNPLRDAWDRIRAHIEGLVPIAAPADQRRQGQAAQNGGAAAGHEGQTRATRGRAAQQPSPEQAAARIIRQNQERQNHGIIRDTIFRVERAMALFLASLVPGVGERHVRAREEARLEAERIENERRAAEDARAAEETAKNDSRPPTDGTTSPPEMQAEPSTAIVAQHAAYSA